MQESAEALKAGDLGTFGALMSAAHETLKGNYEVTIAELSPWWRRPGRRRGFTGRA